VGSGARRVAEIRADKSRNAGAIPILVTSIVRRNFDASGKIKRDQNVPYVEAVRRLAAEKNVTLIDLEPSLKPYLHDLVARWQSGTW